MHDRNDQKESLVMSQVIEDRTIEKVAAQLRYINSIVCICEESRAEIQEFIESSPCRLYVPVPQTWQQITERCQALAQSIKTFRSRHYDRWVLRTKFVRVRTLWDITETFDADPQPDMSEEEYRHSMIEEVDCLFQQLLSLHEYAYDVKLEILPDFFLTLEYVNDLQS